MHRGQRRERGGEVRWGRGKRTGTLASFTAENKKDLQNVSESLTSKITVKTRCPHLVIILLQR